MFFLARRERKVAGLFAAVAAPLVAFWGFGNWVRTGSLFSPGYQNTLPFFSFQYPMVRFAHGCSSTWSGFRETASAIFQAMFVRIPEFSPWMRECGMTMENSRTLEPPYLGSWTLPLGIALLACFLWRCRRRWEVFVPYATFAALFAAFVYAGAGFTYRYAGDFRPLCLLTLLHAFYYLPRPRRPVALRGALAASLVFGAWQVAFRALPQIATVQADPGSQWREVAEGYRTIPDAARGRFPVSVACEDEATTVFADRLGWEKKKCGVDSFTNLFLGLPERESGEYELWAETKGALAPGLLVHVNGRTYPFTVSGGKYRTRFRVDRARLFSPNVLVTIEWSRTGKAPAAKLLRVGVG